MKASRRTTVSRIVWTGLLSALVLAASLEGASLEAGAAKQIGDNPVDVTAWRRIAVFNKGRVQPLDTFAHLAMDSICDKPKGRIKLGPEQYVSDKQLSDPKYAAMLELFPGGKSRYFEPPELVLSWIVEPEKWEDIPFIYAPHGEVRQLLNVDVKNLELKYVSPRQVAEADDLLEHLRDLRDRQARAQAAGREFQPTALDERVQKLLQRYSHYRSITFDPRKPLTHSPIMQAGSRSSFMKQFDRFVEVAQQQNPQGNTLFDILQVLGAAHDTPLSRSALDMLDAVRELAEIGQPLFNQWRIALDGGASAADVSSDVQLEDAEAAVIHLRRAAEELERQLQEQRSNIYASSTLDSSQRQTLGPIFRELASKSRELKRIAFEMHVALYDEGHSLMVAPALNAAALSRSRDPENTAQPWLGLQAILHSDELLSGYPQSQIHAIRAAWGDLKRAYADRSAPDREQACVQAQERLAAALHELGRTIEPQRRQLVASELPREDRDDALLLYTKYPSEPAEAARIDAEVHYNAVDPFKWSWIINLFALACFSLCFGAIRKPMFWVGSSVLVFGLLWTVYAFYLRILITQWAPVTNMYETVVFVPFVVALLGAWFLFLPINWPGIKDAWRITAAPGTWEAVALSPDQSAKFSGAANALGVDRNGAGPQTIWSVVGGALVPVRVGLMAAILYFLAMAPIADGYRPIFRLTPGLEAAGGSLGGLLNALVVWVVGLFCLGLAMWFTPRVLLATLAGIVFLPWNWRWDGRLKKLMPQVYARWAFGFAATFAGAFGAWVAWYAPNDVLNENFSPLQPVLRSNFWLTVHVLTITASYGAGFLALMLGNLAMAYYLFGRYRDPGLQATAGKGAEPEVKGAEPEEGEAAFRRRPPEQCSALAHYVYKSIQVAVLLLAAGTILGGLWADVSWGRFWGWDPKEVWALISLLVYLAIFHGRFAGWFSNFGLIFGAVFGATMIMMSWYGVNFVLPLLSSSGSVGLHSYGTGSGGIEYVAAFIAANWLFLGLATARYWKETAAPVQPAK